MGNSWLEYYERARKRRETRKMREACLEWDDIWKFIDGACQGVMFMGFAAFIIMGVLDFLGIADCSQEVLLYSGIAAILGVCGSILCELADRNTDAPGRRENGSYDFI